ncbi:SMP-30/gluconolactonase/LRE family protein [Pseudomonas guariconensis]|uniref:SMP-30/gluconolactonase/LRE family protein n=1 Tax=Pseudomonas guariconensis TaxID=1288410 RepID=UPI0018A91E76|nr:SMP-30/gluconolactonase/LRE family protein [Pseudomonas guariconensis]MBF8741874.1 SMP-30/gluconolactonase/LRE family protein [Pseudomonas guariconensis]MBF8750848.1 SMP-30/gluconolactonase/LRE family protein [Pseudomonas guariconensis]
MHCELIVDARNATGESPVWHPLDQALYWVDIPAGRLHRWRMQDNQHHTWQAGEMLACIARCAGSANSWIAGMQSGIFHLTPTAQGTLDSQLASPVEHARQGMRFNDGRCDRQGRFWAGTMLMDMQLGARVGALYRHDGEGQPLRAHLEHLIVPNGLAFSPDGKRMYLSDSHPQVQTIWAFDYDIDSGTPHNQRVFVDMHQFPGRPDGAAIDQDGCYWICGNDAGLVHRFTPEGKLDRSLQVPVSKPAMCAFGGPDLDTLFVTSIRPAGVDLHQQPLAGGVFALNVGVKGMEETAYQN